MLWVKANLVELWLKRFVWTYRLLASIFKMLVLARAILHREFTNWTRNEQEWNFRWHFKPSFQGHGICSTCTVCSMLICWDYRLFCLPWILPRCTERVSPIPTGGSQMARSCVKSLDHNIWQSSISIQSADQSSTLQCVCNCSFSWSCHVEYDYCLQSMS